MPSIRVSLCVLLFAAAFHLSDSAFLPPLAAASETVPRETRIAERLAALPPHAISVRHSFVLAAEGDSFLFNPSAGLSLAPFLPEVYKPFGFSSDSRYFLYLKSNGRFPAFSLYAFDLAERADKLISEDSVQYALWSPVTLHAAFISLESATRFRLSVHDLLSGSTREIYSGKIDPEYLEWSPDGRRLFFASVTPENADSFHDQTYDCQVHEYPVFGNRAARSFPSRWAHLNEGLVSFGTNTAEVNRRLAVSGEGEVRRLKVSTGQVYASVLENGEIVTRKLNTDTATWESLGPGEIYTATDDGIVLRSFAEGGVVYQYVSNTAFEPVQRLAFTGVFKLPYQGTAYLVQGGQSYRSGACDGRDCLVIAHKNLLGYSLDFQQTSEEGQGNQHMLAVADGTVVATANNVTCTSGRTSCVVGWDDYSTNCPSNDGAGNYVVIAHPDGTYSLYAHLKSGSVQVAPNQAVSQGTYLAIQGHSGSANSPTGYRKCGDHLHFQRQTGPAVWSQSVPTDFTELPCAPSCMTAHLSSNVERDPAGVSQLTVALSPSTVIGSLTTTANRVLLPSAAPSGGATVALSSSDPGRASVPASVVVPAGSTEATFPINVNGNVTVTTNVTIGANRSGTAASAVLKVAPPKLGLIQLRSSAVTGGTAVNNNDVALTGYASADIVVPLASSVPSALSVPQSVAVPTGASMANFNLQTYPVASQTSVKVSASAGGVTKGAYITVKPGGTTVVAVSVSPKTVSLLTGQTKSFTATVTVATNTSVTWSIKPSVGSITSGGLYTAPSSLSASTTVAVRATSVADSTKYDQATVTVSPPPPAGSDLPFSDDFSSGSLANWTIVDEGATDKPSRWQIQSGVLHQTSNIYTSSTDGAARGTYALTGQTAWTNYTVSVRMQSTDDDGIGVMFGYKDAKNYYRFAMDQSRSFRRLIKMVNGTPTLLAADTVAFQQARWYQVNATMANGVIEVAVDGQVIFRVNDSTHTAGKIALYSWCNIGAQYDDVAVASTAP